jgi:hypothetical protein
MRLPGFALLLFSLQLVAWGQMDDNTLTVAPSRTIALQPDQLAFSVSVDFESTASLADVLSAVQSVGITEANLSGVSTYSQSPFGGTTQWSFVLAVAFSKQGDTLAALATLQKTIGANPNRSLYFSVRGSQVSPQLQASATCPYVALFQDAVAQAQALASAAGQMLGPVLTVSDGTSLDGLPQTTGVVRAVFPAANLLVGDFSSSAMSVTGGFGLINQILVTPTPSYSPSCTLIVQFKLIH